MKPTTEQQEMLSKYLRKNLTYRETYAEFYDHILSALEARSGDMSFQDAVEYIITEDFGGVNGMLIIEKNYKKAITKEMKKKYLEYVVEYLKFPMIGIILSLSFLFYFIALQPWFNFITFMGTAFTIRIIPTLLKWARYFKTGYVFGDTKTSVKDSFFVWLDKVPGFIVVALVVLSGSVFKESPLVWFKSAGPGIKAFVPALVALHTLSFYNVYKDEFKISIIR